MAVSCGGRPDLAGDAIAEVRVPTLLIVRDRNTVVIENAASPRQRRPNAPT